MFAGPRKEVAVFTDEKHCPCVPLGITDQEVYEDYSLYARSVVEVQPLPFVEWQETRKVSMVWNEKS